MYSKLNKHETLMSDSIINITPPHRAVSSQGKSKRKSLKNATETKQCVPVLANVSFDRLNQSIDIITERAAYLFYNGEYKNSISILNE